jgi:hypothetical protein
MQATKRAGKVDRSVPVGRLVGLAFGGRTIEDQLMNRHCEKKAVLSFGSDDPPKAVSLLTEGFDLGKLSREQMGQSSARWRLEPHAVWSDVQMGCVQIMLATASFSWAVASSCAFGSFTCRRKSCWSGVKRNIPSSERAWNAWLSLAFVGAGMVLLHHCALESGWGQRPEPISMVRD